LEAIGQLAAGIAHEINTPMQFIGDNNTFLQEAFSSMLKYISKVESFISEDTKMEIEKIRENADFNFIIEEIPSALDQSREGINRVSNIVKAMKEFAHPGVKEKAFCDINKAIRNTAAISKNEWKYHADLELQLDDSLPMVFCEIDSINQVLLNMIVNAAHAIEKALPEGSSDKGQITIRTENLEEKVCIGIKDTGCGIPKDHLDRIFDPFFTTKDVGKGTGQGLAIVHDIIVNKHKGIIQVDSELNIGTEFKLLLPINDRDAK
jgi:signal transduction histidine kinase